MSSSTLSVLMANYNYGEYVGEALESILGQSFKPLEVIVVDDGSTDNSIEVIETLQKKHPNLKLLKNEKNRGVNYSILKCLEAATGDYVYAASSDDKVLPEFFKRSMEMLIKYPKAGLCCTDNMFDYGKDRVADRVYLSDKPRYFSQEDACKKFLRDPFTPVRSNTAIIKRSALAEAGGFLADLKWSCDTFASSVICFRYGFCYIPEIFTVSRIHPEQYGGSRAKIGRLEREIIKKEFDIICSPGYRDVLPMFERTAAFSTSPFQVLRTAMMDRKYRRFVSFKLFRYAFNDLVKRLLWIILYPISKDLYWRVLNRARKLKIQGGSN